ncbi:MAG: HmuY family protein [Flavobacteriaceae bacterium]
MKTLKILALLALFIGFTSCSDNDDDNTSGNDTISFEGSFSRDFEVETTTQRATYTIAQDKITYDLAGGFAQTSYDITKSYYESADNRWIGYRASNETYYVIFFKNTSDTEITLYKKEIESVEAGIAEPVPAADDAENHGWNTYYANLPVSGTIKNLYTPYDRNTNTGEYVKFSFKTGEITTDNDWDVAFRGTTIIVNGGSTTAIDEPERTGNAAAYNTIGVYSEIKSVDITKFTQDSTESLAITGWYDYNATTHIIMAKPGNVIIVKTHDGKYAKFEITSYYKDGEPDAEFAATDYQYYNFNYAYQNNEGISTF